VNVRWYLTVAFVISQMLGLIAACILAWNDIRSIIGTGGPIALTGIALAAISYRRDRAWGLWFALAGTTLAVLCFTMIVGFHWSPADAEQVVPFCASVATCAIVPLGVAALKELRRMRAGTSVLSLGFSLRQLFAVTLATAILLGLARLENPTGFAIGLAAIYTLVVVWFVRAFYRSRGGMAGEQSPAGESFSEVE
jgi:hypothetical protein